MADKGGFWKRFKRVLPTRPELTVEAAQQAIEQGFAAGKYKVYKTKLIGADIVIRKSGWTGIAVKIKHTNTETIVIYNPFAPSAGVRLLAYGVIPIIILHYTTWKKMRIEFQEFLDSTPLFRVY